MPFGQVRISSNDLAVSGACAPASSAEGGAGDSRVALRHAARDSASATYTGFKSLRRIGVILIHNLRQGERQSLGMASYDSNVLAELASPAPAELSDLA